MNILGAKIDNFSRAEILAKIKFFLQEKKAHQIATINPEFILQAQKDNDFKNILNNCDLNVADGIGIWFAFLRQGKYLKNRLTGVDLMLEILKISAKKNLSIFLVSHSEALSSWEETRDVILKKYPNLKIAGIKIDKNSINSQLPVIDSSIVFCNFGAPQQEKLLYSLKNQKNSKIRLLMGIGGSFDFLTGRIKRAPKCIRIAGLEWLWRFLQEPKYRAKRIFKAVIVFPIKIIFNLGG